MDRSFFRLTGYMGAKGSYLEALAVLIGLPMDFTVSNRPGTRGAPQEIRTVSYALEEYSVYQKRSLDELKFYDAGDVILPYGNVADSLKRIEEVGEKLFLEKKFPLFIGGEHLVTYPLVKACRRHHPELAVVQFDAHADLRSHYEGEADSHATVMYKVAEHLGSKNVYQLGIRSGTREEFAYARQNTRLFVDEIFPALETVVEEIGDRPVYITLDIDVVDPAYAPGTGTPEPGGCTSKDILTALRAMSGLKVVGMDLVEVSPLSDNGGITSVLAAKIIREALLAFVKGERCK